MPRSLSRIAVVVGLAVGPACMISPGDDVTPLGNRADVYEYAGYAPDPNATIQLRCRPPGEVGTTVFATATSSTKPIPWANTTVYAWETSAVVPEACWTPSGPGVAAANVDAWSVAHDRAAFRIPDWFCLWGLESAMLVGTCSAFPAWSRFEAPSDLASGADPLAGAGAPTVVASGLSFAEGPLWDTDNDRLLFTDIETDTIWAVVPGGSPTALVTGSGTHTNGQAWYPGGPIVRMEHATQRVVLDGPEPKVLASTWGGQSLNSPNDALVSPTGRVYFTDPTYGSNPAWGGATPVLGFRGLYRVDNDGTLSLEHAWTDRQPNGIALAPQGDVLYVADTQQGEVLSMAVATDGGLGAPSHFAWVAGADGMAIDVDGNLYATGTAGVSVFSPTGASWGTIPLSQATNCAFGGSDRQTLFITTRPTVYAVDLAVPGTPSAR